MTDWLAPGVVKQHRTLGTLVNRLIGSGFTLTHLDEWGRRRRRSMRCPRSTRNATGR